MTDIKFTIPEDILKRMDKYPEIDWKKVAQSAVKKYLEKLELADRLTVKSKITLEDADKWGDEIKQEMWKRHKYYIEHLEE